MATSEGGLAVHTAMATMCRVWPVECRRRTMRRPAKRGGTGRRWPVVWFETPYGMVDVQVLRFEVHL